MYGTNLSDKDIMPLTKQLTLDIERKYDTMSNMKDYMMWLDDNNVAKWDMTIGELIIPEGKNIYSEELVDAYHRDAEWRNPTLDDDMIIDDEEDEFPFDDDLGDICERSPDQYWFNEQGGLTADAYEFLYNVEMQGELI